MYLKLNNYNDITNHFKQSFNPCFFEAFDKDSFKITDDNTEAEIKSHCESFNGMKAYFKQFTYPYKTEHFPRVDVESYSANKAIYGSFCSYFRAFFSLFDNKNLGISFIVRKDFLAIEAGFQIKDLSSLDKRVFNKIIIHLISEENLFFLSKFNFDLLYTRINKADTEVPLEEYLKFYKENKKEDGIFQLRWKMPRQAFENNQNLLFMELTMANIVDDMITFLESVQQMMPTITIAGQTHYFIEKKISIGPLDKNLLLNYKQLTDKYGTIKKSDKNKIFPDTVNLLKEELKIFFEEERVEGRVSLRYSYKESTTFDWELSDSTIKKQPPELAEVTNTEFLANRSSSDITFVIYRLMGYGEHTYRLKSLSSPLTLNMFAHHELDTLEPTWIDEEGEEQTGSYSWGFIGSLSQNGQILEYADSWNEGAYVENGHRLFVFIGNKLICDRRVPGGDSSFLEGPYDSWEKKAQVELNKLAKDLAQDILSYEIGLILETPDV
jgi:hypothetical protein